jgi:hypothetical protein
VVVVCIAELAADCMRWPNVRGVSVASKLAFSSEQRETIRRVIGVMKLSASDGSNSSSDTICWRMGVAILAQKREKNDGVLGSTLDTAGVEIPTRRTELERPGVCSPVVLVEARSGVVQLEVVATDVEMLRESPISLTRERLLGLLSS